MTNFSISGGIATEDNIFYLHRGFIKEGCVKMWNMTHPSIFRIFKKID